MSNNAALIAISVAGLVISLGAVQAFMILGKNEKRSTRIIKHETWVNRKTGKHENPREGGTRRRKNT